MGGYCEGGAAFDRVQRRRADAIQSAEGWSGFHRGTKAPMSMGAGRAKSPPSDEPAKRFGGLTGAQCPGKAMAGGDGTGARSGPPSQDGVVVQHTSCVR